MRKIVVTVEGGVVQEISGIPDDVIVEVWDYDVDDGDKDLHVDGHGDKHLIATWGGIEAAIESIKAAIDS